MYVFVFAKLCMFLSLLSYVCLCLCVFVKLSYVCLCLSLLSYVFVFAMPPLPVLDPAFFDTLDAPLQTLLPGPAAAP